jgi:hypothetical protein
LLKKFAGGERNGRRVAIVDVFFPEWIGLYTIEGCTYI